MSRGKRFEDEPKLNLKKVFVLVVIIALIAAFVFGIKVLLKKRQNEASYFTEISYFAMLKDGKWGIINSKGEVIIQPEYTEMIAVPDKKKQVFICTYDVNYAEGTYKTKAVDANNSQLFGEYTSVEILGNYDANNIWNESNVLKVEKDGKYGLIDLNGKELLPCVYNKIDTIKGIKNSIILNRDDKLGLANAQGNIIAECEYTGITTLTKEYTDGYIVKNVDGKLGIISINKEKIFECKYEDIKHVCGNDMYIVKENGKWLITNRAGDKTVEISYEDVNYINSDIIIAKTEGKYGIFGMDKSEKVKPEYQSIEYAYTENYIAKKDDKFGIIGTNGEAFVPFEYTSLKYIREGDYIEGRKADDNNIYLIDRNHEVKAIATDVELYNGYIRAKVNNEYKFYNLKFEEKSNRDAFSDHTLYVAKNDGKYGLVNKDGSLVVQYQYEDVTEQNEYGYVGVKKDGKWGVIDQYGNVVVEPKYQITNISKIIFIGNWHSVENVITTYFVTD